jgi:hypothetical protein
MGDGRRRFWIMPQSAIAGGAAAAFNRSEDKSTIPLLLKAAAFGSSGVVAVMSPCMAFLPFQLLPRTWAAKLQWIGVGMRPVALGMLWSS